MDEDGAGDGDSGGVRQRWEFGAMSQDRMVEPVAVAEQPATQMLDSFFSADPLKSSADALWDRTVFVFDWDDTLFPSTALSLTALQGDEDEDLGGDVHSALIDLESAVMSLFENAAARGSVMIVTNSDDGWVHFCSEKYFPRFLAMLRTRNIPVVSARSAYEAQYPDLPHQWKIEAFEDRLGRFCSRTERANVLVVGDGQSERVAGQTFARGRSHARVKTVKLIDQPTIDMLSRQLALLQSSLDYLWEHDGNFDVDLNLRYTNPSDDDGRRSSSDDM